MLEVKSNPPFRKKQLQTSNISFHIGFFLSFTPIQSPYKTVSSLQVTQCVEQSQPRKYNGFNTEICSSQCFEMLFSNPLGKLII